MDPIPKMLIPTRAAMKKGVIEVASVAELDELITSLVLAKTMMLAAISAARPADAADVVDATVYCGARAPWGEECVLEEHRADEAHLDTADRPWFDDIPPCPSCGMAGWHADSCERQAKLAELGAQVAGLRQPAPVARVVEGSPLAPEPDWDGDPKCDSLHPTLRIACEAHKPGLHIAPGFNEGDPDITWPRERVPLASVTPLPLRPDYEVIPELQKPCPEAHPERGTLCTGKIPHPMPHVDEDGETWVTEQRAGAL